MRVQDKIAVVTGAARGMGASHARLLAEQGASVVVCDVLEEEGAATVHGLVADGFRARFVSLDVTDHAGWARAVTDAEAAFGPVSILVNNAGITGSVGGPEVEDPAEFTRTVAVNQTGASLGMRATIPSMRRAGDGDCLAYCATKGALRTMTRSAALKLAPDGIRVNAVCPGIVRTPMNETEQDLGGYIEATPMRRLGEPSEIS